ncbi:MAG TPA: methyltransferase domain-containing protein [Vicinamibacterales bacterium]|nr:methyltransferase domain-containing protein [Vicinamibacterales bacterium]
MRMFLRRSTVGREPLAVTMSGVRMGERALQIGVDDPVIVGALAAKTGLTGQATIVVTDQASAERARAGAADSGALVDLQIAPIETLPFDDGSYDVLVIHSVSGLLASAGAEARQRVFRECRRVLRPGGRTIVLESGTPTGLRALLGARKRDAQYEAAGGTVAALERAGFKAVRTLGDREGYRFIEGLKA